MLDEKLKGVYLNAEEAMIGHISYVSRVIAEVEDFPDKYDPRAQKVLKGLKTWLIKAQVTLRHSNCLLSDIESISAGGSADLKTVIDALELQKHFE